MSTRSRLSVRRQQFFVGSEIQLRANRLARIAKIEAVKKDPTLIPMAIERMLRTRRRKGHIR